MRAQSSGQEICSNTRRNGCSYECQVQSRLAPSQNGRHQRDVIGRKGGILRYVPDRHAAAVPIHRKAKGISRMLLYLPGRPEKQRIINVEGGIQEGPKQKK